VGTTVTLKGADEAQRKLERLPIELRGKTLMSGLRSAGRAVVKEAKSIVPISDDEDGKHLRDALVVKVFEGRVGPIAIVGGTWAHGRHAWLVEGQSDKTPGGFSIRHTSNWSGKPIKTGAKVKKQPFLGPAAQYTLNAQATAITTAIDRAIKRVMG